jgi:Fe-S-cluster containining protein
MMAYVSSRDIRRWEIEERHEILTHVRSDETMWAGDRIVTARGAHLTSCVFLNSDGKNLFCGIYGTRPEICREYRPGSSELCPQYNNKAV